MNPEGRYPDPATVRTAARDAWEKRARANLSVQERIGVSVPWWLVAIAAVFYALSSPHTAGVFDMLTPGWGWVAPIGVEFGLLYAAFHRKQLRTLNLRTPLATTFLQVLLFFVAVVVNGAGALSSVLSATGLNGLPFGEIFDQFARLPAIHQVALPLAAVAALVIPVGTTVAGEGLSSLFLERQDHSSVIERAWLRDKGYIEYEALRDAAIAMGIPPKRATAWADSIINGPIHISKPVSGGVSASLTDGERTISALPAQATADAFETRQRTRSASVRGRPGGHVTPSAADEFVSAAQRVADYLDANPDAASLSVRKLADAAGVGKTVAADALRDYRMRTTEDVSADTEPDRTRATRMEDSDG
jgi:hypothetical protein